MDDGDEVVLIALRAGMTRIGRSPSADICFDHGSVSRRHAAVMTRMDGAVEVLDDGSLNGTFVNGERIRRQVITHGDILTVGSRTLRYLEVRVRASTDQPTQELTPPGCARMPAEAA